MRRAGIITGLLVMGAMASGAMAAEVAPAQIDAAIERGVKLIVGFQAKDGHWPYAPGGAEVPGFQVGHTALMVLALQHSHSTLPESQTAIKKGLAYITQQPPESRTYSAGLVEQALEFDSPARHRALIGTYAGMLVNGIKPEDPFPGLWSYDLQPPTGYPRKRPQDMAFPSVLFCDNSNGQFGILGLTYASKAGYQVPHRVWERSAKYYTTVQNPDGGWDYPSFTPAVFNKTKTMPPNSIMSMTLAGTVSSYLCEEGLADKNHKQCKAPAVNKTHEAGMRWIVKNWRNGMLPYEWYACERLGILTGYSDFGGHDWYQEGAGRLLAQGYSSKNLPDNAFMLLFLARGRNPIIINKLKREGDWNLHHFDISHLVEHISGPLQTPCQWRIVTLESPVELLLKTPILWISGHEELGFTAAEKARLKDYVAKGGTILAEDCCSQKGFDESFRELVKELWPESALEELPKTHPIFTGSRTLENPPTMMGLSLGKEQGRLGVLYITSGISCQWEAGGTEAKGALDVGAAIYLYVDKTNKALRAKSADET